MLQTNTPVVIRTPVASRPRRVLSGLLTMLLAATVVLAAPSPAQAASPFVSDGFDTPELGSHWEVVRPWGVGSASVSDGRLVLSVPAGVSHDPASSADVVRVVQSVPDGDLAVQARFESVPSVRYQMQGLLAEQSETSFVRADVYFDGSQLRVYAATTVDGVPVTRVSKVLPASLSQVFLRLERSGDVWSVSWSGDGVDWTVAGSFTQALSMTRVGPFVGNHGSSANQVPAFTALVDYVVDPAVGVPSDPPGDDPDLTPPQVGQVQVVASESSAVVSWVTDEVATGYVEYGPTSSYGFVSSVTAAGLSHSVVLSGLTADTEYHFRVVASDLAENTAVTDDDTFTTDPAGVGPVIDVWYGDQQVFGPPGAGQVWVNILGNVSDPDGVAALTYSLNNGGERPLSIGPDRRRLQWPGDFNVDIPFADLSTSGNTVTLTAVDGNGNVSTRTVNVLVRSGPLPQLPYDLTWDPASGVAEQVQVVDGKWTVTADGLRTDITGYDRLVALGDLGWSDYELTVPMTVHEFGPAAYTPLSGAPMVGVGLRWNGHTPVGSDQPAWDWYPTGAFAWYRFYENGGRFVLSGNQGSPAKYTHLPFDFHTPYLLKVRVETVAHGVTRYQVKLWRADAPEPGTWMSSIDVSGGPEAGTVVLIAHQLHATFGDVQVRPV